MHASHPSLNPLKWMWLGLLALGLTLAACGGQAEVAVSEQPTESLPEIVTEELTSPDVQEDTNVEDPDPASGDATAGELSPLAEIVIELPPALPEIALQGVGDPIGTQPESISLPSLGVASAPIVPVGLEPNGELEVPDADTVGWYEFGAGVDGGRGSAVLAAHIAYNGRDGVFLDLVDLEPGDEISVERDGQPVAYIVESVVDYDKWELPIDDLFSESSEERIVLITCGGSFNPELASYEDNTVVVASPA